MSKCAIFLYKWQELFIEDLELNEKDLKTISNYHKVTDNFIFFIDKTVPDIITMDINTKTIQLFLKFRKENIIARTKKVDISIDTKKNDIKVVRLFLNFIDDTSKDDFNFHIKWNKITPKPQKKEKPHIITEELNLFLGQLENNIKNRRKELDYVCSFAFKLALYGGLRASEICDMTLKGFSAPYEDSGSKFIDVTIKGKGNTQFSNPLPYLYIKKELSYFARNRNINDDIFLNTKGYKLSRQSLYQYFAKISQEAGVQNTEIHKIRHTYAHSLVNLGVDLMEMQDLLRHSDPTTSRIYLKRNKQRMIGAVKGL